MASDTLPEPGFFEKHGHRIEYGAPSGCWLWTAGTNGKGYGIVRARGKDRRAHREAFEAEHGAGSADGLVVRHKCDTPACVNHAHLELGTHADNVRDRVERGRQARQKGEVNGRSKLTEDDVRAIRADYVRGSGTHGACALGRKYGVSSSLIGLVARGKIWSHVS